MSEPFIAEMRIMPFNFAPRGWAFCDGALLPITNNTALFSIIGTTYGGDGRATMALPNLQGRAPMHPGRGPGLSARRLGEKAGSEQVRLSEAELPVHHHFLMADNEDSDLPDPVGNSLSNRPAYHQDDNSTVDMAPETVGSSGGGAAHDNMQPYLTLNFCIALQGLYPSRS